MFFDALSASEKAVDYRFGVLASLIANAHLRKKHAPAFKPGDFFDSLAAPVAPRAEMTADEMRAVIGAHFGITA